MASKIKGNSPERPPRRRATTPEARENQVIAAAVDLAEKQLLEGTASSQVITYYLKLGSSRERLEQERLRQENALLAAKAEMLASQKNMEKVYEEALIAMSSYSGREMDSPQDDFD